MKPRSDRAGVKHGVHRTLTLRMRGETRPFSVRAGERPASRRLFNLGMTQFHLHRPDDAADYLRRSLAVRTDLRSALSLLWTFRLG